MNWNEFAKDVHQVAVANGLWDKPPSFEEFAVLCHMDLSKAAEAYRDGEAMVYFPCSYGGVCINGVPVGECPDRTTDPQNPDGICLSKSKCPHGVAAHLADCILRILDYLAAKQVIADLEYWHWRRDNLYETLAECHSVISLAYGQETGAHRGDHSVYTWLRGCVTVVVDWATQNNVDMESILQAKHTYNKSRVRHDGVDKPQEVTP